MNLLEELAKNPFGLAPMAGVTDCGFRSFMRENGCGVVISELVSATGLAFESEKTRKLMRFEPIQRPVGIQLFGETLDHLSHGAKQVEQLGADFVDLNFGCPVPKVVKKGAGSALLKDLIALRDVLRVVRSSVSIPVTIKVRTGWDAQTRNADQVAQIAYDEGITWMAIHGRTRAQGYDGQADWDYIAWVKSVSKIPVLGNGDITNPLKAVERLKTSRCDGVLIGRGCLKNPWIFKESLALWQNSSTQTEKNFSDLLVRLKTHLERHFDARVTSLQLKKFAAWFSAGYPESSIFRKTIFQTQDPSHTYDLIADYFLTVQNKLQTDTSNEPFLMGGHG